MTKKHPTSRRTPHKEEHPDDIFVAKTLEFSHWASQHRQALIMAGVTLALLVGGGLYWRSYRQSLRVQAVEELERIQQTRNLGDRQTAKADLESYLQRFEGMPTTEEARLILGQLHLETRDVDQAIEVLEPLARSRTPLATQGAYLLASAYEESGRKDTAEELYLTVANRAELGFRIREALAQAARIRSERGDYAGAAALYEEILSYFDEDDPERNLFEMRLAEAQALRKD